MTLDIEPRLVRAAADGDRAGQAALLEIAWPHAYRLARSVLKDDATAEDAAQEACAKVLSSIGGLRKIEAFGTWFCRLVVRQALSELKKRRTHSSVERIAKDPTDSYATAIDVRTALFALPLKLRVPTILHHYYGFNSQEIGQIVGAPSATVRFRLAQARRSMQRLLSSSDNRAYPPKEAVQ